MLIRRTVLRMAALMLLGTAAYAAEALPTIPPAVMAVPQATEAPAFVMTFGDDGGSGSETGPVTTPAPLGEYHVDAKASAQEKLAAAARATQEPAVGIVPIKITCVGDCTLGGDVKSGNDKYFVSKYNSKGPDYFFKNVRMLFETDDITIVNLEGTLTTSSDLDRKTFNFKGDPKYVQILSGSSVELANLANNHMMDYSTSGYEETKSVLDSAGIYHSGFEETAYFSVKGVRIGSVGFTKWTHETEDMVSSIRAARPNCDILLASVHWGTEGKEKNSSEQREQAHAMIDAGADIVIGTHTHTYGGLELYKGKYILYSLGNFSFGGNHNPKKKDTLIFQQVLNWDTVNRTVTDGGISVIPARISSSRGKNDFQPYIQTGEAGEKLLKKIFKVSRLERANTNWMAESYERVFGTES